MQCTLTKLIAFSATAAALIATPAGSAPVAPASIHQAAGDLRLDFPVARVGRRGVAVAGPRGGAYVRRGAAAVGPRGAVAVRRTTVVGPRGRAVTGGAVVRSGRWARPGGYWWRPGGAVVAGAAIGFVAAATAVAWAGAPPGPNMCWYYTDPSRTAGFWDLCP